MNRPTTDTDMRAYLDAHGTDGAPDEDDDGIADGPLCVVEFATDDLCRRMGYGFASDGYVRVAWGAVTGTMQRHRFTRHAPLRLAAPGVVETHPDEAEVARQGTALRVAAERAALAFEILAAEGRLVNCNVAALARDLRSGTATERDAAVAEVAGHRNALTTLGALLNLGSTATWREACAAVAEMLDKTPRSTGRWAERALCAEAWAVAAMTRVAELEAPAERLSALAAASIMDAAKMQAERDAAVARAEKAEVDARRWCDLAHAAESQADRGLSAGRALLNEVAALRARVADLEAEVAGLRAGMAEAMVPHLRQMEAGDYVNGGDMLDDVCAAAGIDRDAVRRASEDERRRWEGEP